MRKTLFALATATSMFALTSAHAQEPTPQERGKQLNEKLGEGSAKWGISIVRAVVQSVPDAKFIAPAEAGASKAAIEDVVNGYNSRKASVQGKITLQEGAVNLAADVVTAGAVYLSGGTAAVPAVMVRTAVQAATDDFFGSVRADATESLRGFLARNQNKILNDAGLTYEELRARPPEEIRQRLDAGNRTFRELDRKVTDPQLRTMARELVVETIVNTQKATLDEVARQGIQIGDLNGRVNQLGKAHAALANFTTNMLDRQQQSINNLNTAVTRLDRAVVAVDARLSTQERNMEIVQDFMFDKMSPEQKATALRSGFMAARFSCPPGAATCDQAKLKSELIERFEAEASIQRAVATAGQVVQDANNLVQIAQNLGINIGGNTTALVQYGTVAFNAFAAAATGNYIGAVASLTGAFAKKGPDPQMKYLAAQFAQINAKLDQVLRNQQLLSEQITALSTRLDEHMAKLHQRLDNVDFRLAQIRALSAMAINQPWQDCHGAYSAALDPQKQRIYGFDSSSSTFPTIEKASQFAHDHRLQADACTAVVTRAMGSFATVDWFGNFLNSATQVSANDDTLKKVFDNREDTWAVLQDYLAKRNVGSWQAFRLFANPSNALDDVRRRITVAPAGEPCSTAGPLAEDRLQKLLCETTPSRPPNASAAASVILKTPMMGDHAIDVASWTLVEQAYVDVQTVRPFGAPVTAMELLSAPSSEPISKGEQHVERALLTLDAAMANAAMLSGDVTVDAVLDVLRSAKLADPAGEKQRQEMLSRVRRMLTSQPALARNVAMALLRDRLAIYNNGLRTGVKPLPAAYPTALRMAQQATGGNPFTIFDTLFGKGLEFRRSTNGQIYLVLMAQADKLDPVSAPVPEPVSLASGRLYYPSMVEDLAHAREQVGTRYLDYQAVRALAPETRRVITATLARAEGTAP